MKKNFVIHIHPVLPMIEATSSLVMSYNSIYKDQVDALNGRSEILYW